MFDSKGLFNSAGVTNEGCIIMHRFGIIMFDTVSNRHGCVI